jgi:hypothetical protein
VLEIIYITKRDRAGKKEKDESSAQRVSALLLALWYRQGSEMVIWGCGGVQVYSRTAQRGKRRLDLDIGDRTLPVLLWKAERNTAAIREAP